MRDALRAVAEELLLAHTNPWELDEAMVSFGFGPGVCEAQDDEGLIACQMRRDSFPPLKDQRPVSLLDRMVSEGRQGRAASVGWYRYPGGGGLVIDPLVEDLLCEEARFAGIERVDLNPQDIIGCLIRGLVNVLACRAPVDDPETARRLNSASLSAIGYPGATGGLFATADQTGVASVCDALKRADDQNNTIWQPAPALVTMAARGVRFMPG
ncbi:3-hydroxyacyl-CoA dehydrogenase family protein [uncultured Roseobacter sp.]|uniref:3-hydroxyacyl-CoA dehydrogenase family protein n=1 Tax=uncultured Roseobacter sp. TaxID=114847 RepID=UPI002602AE65|nr:3-hydroxyacyl-CoA dehydrogenase family protein [uncultured Roseobacter sp.]